MSPPNNPIALKIHGKLSFLHMPVDSYTDYTLFSWSLGLWFLGSKPNFKISFYNFTLQWQTLICNQYFCSILYCILCAFVEHEIFIAIKIQNGFWSGVYCFFLPRLNLKSLISSLLKWKLRKKIRFVFFKIWLKIYCVNKKLNANVRA